MAEQSSSNVGTVLLLTNSILCIVAVNLVTTNPIMSVMAAMAATATITIFKTRCPVSLLWPVTALAVVAQTMASSGVMSVPATVVVSPIVMILYIPVFVVLTWQHCRKESQKLDINLDSTVCGECHCRISNNVFFQSF